jgi:hypothetical protein
MHFASQDKKRVLFLFFALTLFASFSVPQSSPQVINQPLCQPLGLNNEFDTGQILFSPTLSKTTYLIDRTGAINRTWSSDYLPGMSVYMLKSGSILRSILLVGGAGGSGGVERYTYDGDLNWHFEYYSPNQYQSHHDIEPLPNGNVLLLAFELKTPTEVINAGRNPNLTPQSNIEFDYVVEVQPTGPTTGTIVWEWHSWDHLIQDYDSKKANYGVVADHPELIDINFGGSQTDWLHCNSVDYNEQYDQIMLSSRNLNEIYIIDHSTTTTESSGHTGGNIGKGGDLLYRWGNPRAYRAGTTNDKRLFGQHDAQWIPEGYPGAGNILIFNNGVGRYYSSVDEIIPPVNTSGHYSKESGMPFAPISPLWSYTAEPPGSFYASYISGCQRLPNGNTLICDGPAGRFFEVTPDKTMVWQYVNPYPSYVNNNVFKIQYIPPKEPEQTIPDLQCYGGLSWSDIKAGSTVTGTFQVKNVGGNNSSLNWTIDSAPNWGSWSFTPQFGVGLTPENGFVTVHVNVVAPENKNTNFEGYIQVVNEDDPTDFDTVPVFLKTSKNTIVQSFLFEFLKDHPFLFSLLRLLLHS